MGHQDRRTSHGRQREAAKSLIAGAGVIVADYFDIGVSREVSWAKRPQGAALLEALADTLHMGIGSWTRDRIRIGCTRPGGAGYSGWI